jgi:hypothetical protein
MRTGSFQDSFLDVLKDGNGNLNEIIKDFVAFKDKEKGGIKGVNLATKQALKDKKNATCSTVKIIIPVTLPEYFKANSSFDNVVSAMVIIIEAS